MAVHSGTRDSLQARGVRLLRSKWKDLEAIQTRRGDPTVQDTVREAVDQFIAREHAVESEAA